MRDDAEWDALAFQHRPLLDMRLEIGAEASCGGGVRISAPAAFGECGGEGRLPEAVRRGEQAFLGREAHRDLARRHGGREARAFLIRPVDDRDGCLRARAAGVQRADNLEPQQHAIGAVVLAAGRHAIEMAADCDRGQRRIGTRIGQHHAAEPVDRERAPCGECPVAQQRPRLAILRRQREAVHAAIGPGADARHVREALPEPVRVEAQRHAAFSSPHHSAMVSAMVRVMSCMESRPTLSSMP